MAFPDAFEIPHLLPGIQICLAQLRGKMVKEAARDPVPKFKLDGIRVITQLVQIANASMQSFIETFHGAGLQGMSDELLDQKLKAARESSRQLGLLLNDSTALSSFDMKHFSISETRQKEQTQEDIKSLIMFFETFGNILTPEYKKSQIGALQLLRELLSPGPPSVMPELALITPLRESRGSFSADLLEHRRTLTRLIHMGGVSIGDCVKCRDKDSESWKVGVVTSVQPLMVKPECYREPFCWAQVIELDKDCFSVGDFVQCRNKDSDSWKVGVVTSVQPLKVKLECMSEPLSWAQVVQSSAGGTATDALAALVSASRFMTHVFEQEQRHYNELQIEVNEKMDALNDFAQAVTTMLGVLKQYLLIRVGDISDSCITTIKKWFGKGDIDATHKLLEEFRDIAVQEKALREMSARMGLCAPMSRTSSVASMPSSGEFEVVAPHY